jgi:hypothetical protein
MTTKEKIIKNAITIYLTDEENEYLRDIVEEKKISMNQFVRDAINLKFEMDNPTDLKKEANDLLERLTKRCNELKQ